jgi:hypothetical protein
VTSRPHVPPSPSGNRADAVLNMQRLAGNRAVTALIASRSTSVPGSGGRPLDASVRGRMEERFNHDFSDVRVHTDPAAAQSASAISAKAYTVGRDIVFSEGRFAPQGSEGQRLLAHELAHVVQQQTRPGGRAVGSPVAESPSLEAEASRAATSIATGVTPQITGSARPGLARAKKVTDEDAKNVGSTATAIKGAVSGTSGPAPGGGVPWKGNNIREWAKQLAGIRREHSRMLKEAVPRLPSNENYVYQIVTGGQDKFGVTNNPLRRLYQYARAPRFPGDTMNMGKTWRGMTILTRPDAHLAVPQAKGLESHLAMEAGRTGVPSLNQKLDTLLTEQNIRGAEGSRVSAAEGLTHTPTGAYSPYVTLLNPRLYPPRLPKGGVLNLVKNLAAKAKLGGDTRGAVTPRGAFSGAMSGLQVLGAIQQYKDMRAKGIDPVEAAATSGAQLYGGLKGPGGGGVGAAINLANTALQMAGAPKQLTDVTATAASATPSTFIPTLLGQGARSYVNIGKGLAGDSKAIDRQVKEMIEGKGAMMPLSGYARPVDIAADLASGKGFEQTMLKQKFVGQEENVWGLTGGPMLLRQVKLAEGLIKGHGLKAAAQESKEMDKNALSNRAVDYAGEQGAQFVKKDIPEALEFAKHDVSTLKDMASQKIEENTDAAKALFRNKAESLRKLVPW